ncbi:hypothetical protein Ddye_001215 [Dipteronia dyeriana]|uniref:Endonuclease/exonuclease/phosphatase domain-containing protein n=1 Tax=Dipteronia dyeriana TaxID=168575 RepID=A0AAD9XN16_9ROSI|nr:hypothetical protein Ddye_001215 [Dipteronia dyeriana]
METKSNSVRVEELLVKLGFSGKLVVDLIGRSGGLYLLWSHNVVVDLVLYSQYHIDVKVQSLCDNVWRLTGFYGDPVSSQRCHSWTLLRRLACMSPLPWVVIGDFNEIVYYDVKKGGVPRDWRNIASFREALNDCSLVDLG